jgi:hypothetical protein
MKTAMQELIELIEKGETRLDLIENHKQIWLEKEKEQIKMDYVNGKYYHQYDDITSEDYYNKTYNQNK